MRKLVTVITVLSLSVYPVFGWSAEGHKAVAIVAQQLLTSSGQFTQVQTLLGDLSLADIATCPDEVREHERNHNFEMSAPCQALFPEPPAGTESWHFVDIPVTLSNPTHADITAACGENCVLTKIVAFGQVLGDTSQPDAVRLQALSFVVHFIGDLHQPLHAAVRDKDAGGNAEQVKIGRQKTNLHHAWDDPLVSEIDADPTNLANDLASEIQSAQSEPKTAPEDWAIESFQFAKSTAYKGVPAANGKNVVATLGPSYQNRAQVVIRQQLARAGVRLAQFIADCTASTSQQ
jgi:hypothetical protein